MKSPVQQLAGFLKDHQLTIALAESITCGLAAHKLGSVSGTSDFLTGSIVCYSEKAKTEFLNLKPALIKKYTAESQQTTDALALNLQKLINADIYVAITGLAAPGGSETKLKPVGTVFFTLVFRKKKYTLKKKFNGRPLEIKEKACGHLFAFIIQQLKPIV